MGMCISVLWTTCDSPDDLLSIGLHLQKIIELLSVQSFVLPGRSTWEEVVPLCHCLSVVRYRGQRYSRAIESLSDRLIDVSREECAAPGGGCTEIVLRVGQHSARAIVPLPLKASQMQGKRCVPKDYELPVIALPFEYRPHWAIEKLSI